MRSPAAIELLIVKTPRYNAPTDNWKLSSFAGNISKTRAGGMVKYVQKSNRNNRLINPRSPRGANNRNRMDGPISTRENAHVKNRLQGICIAAPVDNRNRKKARNTPVSINPVMERPCRNQEMPSRLLTCSPTRWNRNAMCQGNDRCQ